MSEGLVLRAALRELERDATRWMRLHVPEPDSFAAHVQERAHTALTANDPKHYETCAIHRGSLMGDVTGERVSASDEVEAAKNRLVEAVGRAVSFCTGPGEIIEAGRKFRCHCGEENDDQPNHIARVALERLWLSECHEDLLTAAEGVDRDRHDAFIRMHNDEQDALHTRAERAESERDALRSRLEEAERLLRETADELDRWGWGDLHYGDSPQDKRARVAAKRAHAFLSASEQSTQPIAKISHEGVVVHINRLRHLTRAGKTSGTEIRALPYPPVRPDYDLWLEVPGGMDRPIADDDYLNLSGGEQFYTAPRVINAGLASEQSEPK